MSKVVKNDCVGLELACPTCGKHFFPTPEWAYKNNKGEYVCRYTCTRPNQKKRTRTNPTIMYSIAVPLSVVGNREIIKAATLKAGFSSVGKWCESMVMKLYEETETKVEPEN